ncbi:Carbohydrate esterase family 4 protein [Mycena sanguinolenta]|uniref:chitin deacetylase n=1 Tax=Mycena sanguinolenta TaxID=230812 RepID=A0A8H7CNM0_9AGAR|nr:Carbohydrate esterase family 4 protein [Mycena sanguinolenta]
MRTSISIAAAFLLLSGAHAQTPTDEASEAALTDMTEECTNYNYAPVVNAASSFPTLWTPVSSVPTTDPGYAKFIAMNASIPNIAPKGTLGVPDNTINTYPSSDPDCWWTESQCTTPKTAGVNPDIASVPEPRTLGYGFDDGPNCSHNAFYDYLESKNQKATLYYIGSSVMIWPLQAQRAVADGHEICVRECLFSDIYLGLYGTLASDDTWSHRSMTAFNNEQAFGELWYTMQAIKLVTGVTPTCWRPPLGDVDDRIRYIAQQLGLETIIWKYDTFDWQANDAAITPPVTPQDVQNNYNTFINDATSGDFNTIGAIVLTHELNNFTMQTAIDNYEKLVAAFDHIMPVGVALNKTTPYVETNYTQSNFEEYVAARAGGSNSTSGSSGSSATGSNSGSPSGTGSKAQTTGTGSSAGVTIRASGLTLVLALVGALFIAQ